MARSASSSTSRPSDAERFPSARRLGAVTCDDCAGPAGSRDTWCVAVQAVVFDIGGVLEMVDDATWPDQWLRRWAGRSETPMSAVKSRVASYEPTDGFAVGLVTEAQMRDMYAEVLDLPPADVDQMMSEMWDLYCGTLDTTMYRFCASLRPRYRTGILSNSTDGARREEQRRYGFEQLVDVLVYSHEVGVAKPDPAIYGLTAERLGVSHGEVILIDDVAENVEAASNCGWSAVLHRDAATTINEVRRLLN